MNELHAHATRGLTLYAVLLTSSGQAWDGSAFVSIDGDDWGLYALGMAEAAAGIYLATMPAVGAGVYSWLVYRQDGVAPAVGDRVVGQGEVRWAGTAEEGMVLEGDILRDDVLRMMAAVLLGESSGSGTNEVAFRGLDGVTVRATATLDGNGNRTAVVLDGGL
jgi:hypothetical protein